MATISRPNAFQRAKQFLIGNPLPTTEAEHKTINNKVGLAVFASDVLPSATCAIESNLEVLVATVPVFAGLYR
jgi:hypothetical protein